MEKTYNEKITKIIKKLYPDKTIKAVTYKLWLKKIFKIEFTDRSKVYIKMFESEHDTVKTEANDEIREAFLNAYNRPVNYNIIDCFLLHYRLCALNDTYMQPYYKANNSWKAQTLLKLDTIIKRIPK